MFSISKKTVCEKVSSWLPDYIDGQLNVKNRTHVELHLSWCELCQQELVELRTTIEILGNVEESAVPCSFAISPVKASAMEKLEEHGERTIRWLRPALALSIVIFIVMLIVDFVIIGKSTHYYSYSTLGTSSLNGVDWRYVFRIVQWGWGSVVLAFVIAFIYVSWRRHRGLPDHSDHTDLLR